MQLASIGQHHRSSASRLAWAGAALASITLLAACTSSGNSAKNSQNNSGAPAPSTSSTAVVKGGTMTIGVTTAWDTLDPNVASSDIDYVVMRNIFDSLVHETADHTFQPWLADSWQVSSDGKQYTFHLRSGVKFQDGTAFDAAAVKANLDRITDPDTASQYAVSLLGPYKSSTVVDPTTIKLTLKKAFSPLLEGLSQAFLGIESPAAIAKYGKKVGDHPVGTGPFSLKSEVTGQQVVLAKNPNYNSPPKDAPHTGPAYLDELKFTVVANDSSRIGALQSGQLDGVQAIPANRLQAIKSDSALNVDVVDIPGAVYSLYLNQDKKPWDQPAARLALRSAIDVDSIIKTLYFGQYKRAWSVLSPATPSYDKSLENSWQYDADGAKAAFVKLGYTVGSDGMLSKDGQPLTLNMVNDSGVSDNRLEIDTILQQQLAKAGVKMTIQHVPFATYASLTEADNYGMESFTVTTGSPSVLDTIFNSANQPGPNVFLYNVAHYDNPQVDQMGSEAGAASDPATQDKLYGEIQQAVVGSATVIPLYVSSATFATSKDVHGMTYDPRSYPTFYNTYIAK